jgi:hypothetical protein
VPDPVAALGRALARTLPGGPADPDAGRTRPEERLHVRVGTVTAVDSVNDVATVTTDGETDRVEVPSLVAVAVSDVVVLLEQPPVLVILGKVADL